MGFKSSKGFKILQQDGMRKSCIYILRKFKILPVFNGLFIPYLLQIYPKIALNGTQYKTFTIIKDRFLNNYKGIIKANPIFFKNNLKKHIEWLESDLFKKEYIELIRKKHGIKIDNIFDIVNFTPPPPTASKYGKETILNKLYPISATYKSKRC